MIIRLAIGIFFAFLGLVFGTAALADYRRSQRQWGPLSKARRNIAISFLIVGLALVIFTLVNR
jgi:hypothetical protein